MIKCSRIRSSAQDYAVLGLLLNMVENFISAPPKWSCGHDLYHWGTSSQRTNRRGRPLNIGTRFIRSGGYVHIFIHTFIFVYMNLYKYFWICWGRGSGVSVPFVYVTYKEYIQSALSSSRHRNLNFLCLNSQAASHTMRHHNQDTSSDTNTNAENQRPKQRQPIKHQNKGTPKAKADNQTPHQRHTIWQQSKGTISNSKAQNTPWELKAHHQTDHQTSRRPDMSKLADHQIWKQTTRQTDDQIWACRRPDMSKQTTRYLRKLAENAHHPPDRQTDDQTCAN